MSIDNYRDIAKKIITDAKKYYNNKDVTLTVYEIILQDNFTFGDKFRESHQIITDCIDEGNAFLKQIKKLRIVKLPPQFED